MSAQQMLSTSTSTTTIRIPIVINANGKWSVSGGDEMSDDEAAACARDGMPLDDGGATVQHWIAATVDVPRVTTIAGTVQPASHEAAE